jgi:hypothetical protein
LKSSGQTIEQRLIREQRLRKRRQYLRRWCVLGTILCCLTLCVGFAVQRGLITSRAGAICTLLALSFAVVLGWIFSMARVVRAVPRPSAVAAEFERAEPRLQDRLNTLVFLQDQNAAPRSKFLLVRIADQARRILRDQRAERLKTACDAAAWLGMFALAIGTVFWLNHRYSPWERLRSSPVVSLIPNHSAPDLGSTLMRSNVPANKTNWGEVRITQPGTDLRVGKMDVVPLLIESATEQALQTVYWCSAVNGAAPKQHDLPPPLESHYAALRASVDLSEMQLGDWDVVSYYAKAETAGHNTYSSDIYFLEVRPLREDMLRMPGGESGMAYRGLNDLSALVENQEHVIRATHQLVERPLPAEHDGKDTPGVLASSEAELADSARYMEAEMAANPGNQAIRVVLEHLAQAEKFMAAASTLLAHIELTEAQGHEQAALTELVVARKEFQRAVTERPAGFVRSQSSGSAAGTEEKNLADMAEFRDEHTSAQAFIQDAVEQQKAIEQNTARTNQDAMALADQEQGLEHRLREFVGEHPRAFSGLEPHTSAARDSLQRAGETMRHSGSDSALRAREATQELESLGNAIESHGATELLADNYRLKQMLEDKVRMLEHFASSSEQGAAEQVSSAAASAQAILEHLRRNMGRPHSGFGQSIRAALSSTNEAGLEGSLSKLQQAQTDAERRSVVQTAIQQVEELKEAFAATQPKPLRDAHQGDLLRPETSGLAEGLEQLQNLLAKLDQTQSTPRNQLLSQARQASASIEAGLRDSGRLDTRATDLLQQLNQLISSSNELDPGAFKNVVAQLARFSVEASVRTPKVSEPELANIDRARLPATYKARIQKYFQKLSEE